MYSHLCSRLTYIHESILGWLWRNSAPPARAENFTRIFRSFLFFARTVLDDLRKSTEDEHAEAYE
jgi:hypothetical protein